MEETNDDTGQAEQGPSNSTWWGSEFVKKFGSVSLASQEEALSHKEAIGHVEQDEPSSQTASQVLWSTGMLSEPIPDGFYSVVLVSSFIQEFLLSMPLTQVKIQNYVVAVMIFYR